MYLSIVFGVITLLFWISICIVYRRIQLAIAIVKSFLYYM